MNENNLRQVEFPEGAEIITNRIGTADAFVTYFKNGTGKVPVISLPGVPKELELLFAEQLRVWLKEKFTAENSEVVDFAWRCFGCSESYLGKQIESCNLPAEIEVSYRPMFPEILLTFSHRGDKTREVREKELKDFQPDLATAIGENFIISNKTDQPLAGALVELLKSRRLKLAVGESCSGGLISHMLVSQPGASECFNSSVVTYSNESKAVYLGVRPDILKRYGAVSREVAIEMARGAKFRTGSDIGVSVTGIAGPDGGSPEKPVGTFFLGLVTADFEEAWPHFFPHERNMFRSYCSALALDLVRRKVLELPLTWERK